MLKSKFTKAEMKNKKIFTVCKSLQIKDNELGKAYSKSGTQEIHTKLW